VYALMAVGLTLIFGVLDIINIAQGILVVLAAYLSYLLSVHLHLDLFLGIAGHDAGDVRNRRRDPGPVHAAAAGTGADVHVAAGQLCRHDHHRGHPVPVVRAGLRDAERLVRQPEPAHLGFYLPYIYLVRVRPGR
jgi:hypothetical protein